MKFATIEQFSIAGSPERVNEDALAEGPYFAVVIDGATTLGENLMPGPSDAQWLARFGARRLAAHASAGAGAPRDWVRSATEDARTSYTALRRRAPKQRYEIPCASMMAVAVENDAVTALWFGDCTLIVKTVDGHVTLIGDAVEARGREAARAKSVGEAEGGAAPPAPSGVRHAALPMLRKMRNRVNGGGGSWLFGTEPACADHVNEIEARCGLGATLLLASDGLFALVSDYGRYDAAEFIAAAENFGLETLGEELRAVEAADANGAQYPRFKRSDDATGLLLRLVP